MNSKLRTRLRPQADCVGVIIGSPNVDPGYPLADNADYSEIAADFARTFQTLKSLPCDIFLGAHCSDYDMEAKYEKLKPGTTDNPFVDPQGYRAYVTDREKYYLDALNRQKK